MKSNKQRRLEIKAKRRKRAEALKARPFTLSRLTILNSLDSDQDQLMHNPYYALLPSFYLDKPFKCRDCDKHEVWSAISQKWWYEIAKGYLSSTAIHCKACRIKRRKEKEQQRILMFEAAKREPHPNEVFFKKRY
jgi:hypothetical protein